ncbi:hypothetical protein ARMGADRAFT_1091350 [Armillaria gallica]|uniref:Uncharacterized protein n=1 Tax=Armillaria gallica TaxID=47427 RepID=A0A2H3CE46_ARMGA|nr:hypothetical protein ARMGADRAFT_1091350 [Armillaria gallica]
MNTSLARSYRCTTILPLPGIFRAYDSYGNVPEALITQQRHRYYATSTWTTSKFEGPTLSKASTDVWRTWIGDEEIKETYRLLPRNFPDDSWATRSPNNDANNVDAFCSLHFGIVFAGLLSPPDTRLSSLPIDEQSSPTSISEGIIYTTISPRPRVGPVLLTLMGVRPF